MGVFADPAFDAARKQTRMKLKSMKEAMFAVAKEKTTTKEHQDKVVKRRLQKRDENMAKNKKDHREFLQDAYDKTYKLVENMNKK